MNNVGRNAKYILILLFGRKILENNVLPLFYCWIYKIEFLYKRVHHCIPNSSTWYKSTQKYWPSFFCIFIADKPYCRPDQQDVYGVATGETVRIPCDVFGDPKETMKFEWVFNTSTEWYPKQPDSALGVTSAERGWTRAYIQHTPKVIF